MEREENRRLYARLKEYADSGIYPFHMPGHKRRYEPEETGRVYRMDITEIDGFDDLHDPSGILKEEMERAAAFYGTKETIFSVNGSTGALLAAVAITASAQQAMQRDVYNAIRVFGLED